MSLLRPRETCMRRAYSAPPDNCRLGRPHQRRGAAALELACVAPVLLLFVLGIIELGRLFMVQQVVVAAAREGARIGVLDGATTASVTTRVQTYLAGTSVTGATITVSPNPPGSANAGQPVTVSVSVPYTAVSWLSTPIFAQNAILRGNSTMRRESYQ
jgi:Flp pilus assembly protein TadG